MAEAELEADIRTSLRKIYYGASGEAQQAKAKIENPAGFLDRLIDLDRLPPWLTEADLDHCVGQFRTSGFRGGLNPYRISERDFAQLAEVEDKRITQPAAFLAGELDHVLPMLSGVDLVESMRVRFDDLRLVKLFANTGHWLQQERPTDVNAALLAFLLGLPA